MMVVSKGGHLVFGWKNRLGTVEHDLGLEKRNFYKRVIWVANFLQAFVFSWFFCSR